MAFYYQVKSSVDQTLFSDTYTDKHTHIHLCIYNYIYLSYDPDGPARAFIAKLLIKSPYEGCTRWREQGREKPSGPVRIAYGPHTGILSTARARCELKQLCCYINPDFSVKMSHVTEYSDSEFYYPKKTKTKKKGKVLWSCDKMLIDWVRSGRTGKYLALGHGVRTSLLSVRTPNILPSGPPTQSISTYYVMCTSNLK